MTLAEALAIPLHTDEFDAAVDLASDACAANPKDREAAAVLMLLLQRNEDGIQSALWGIAA